ncbi:MAG TPA: DNA helicase UvrD [Candidatus Margulisbacteria bacterium]|nr:MAG: hypothetical protein A2X43_05000 [Candidatus Margulisbacteria bacterium GWD2_39_127]HAR64203.1 DNA helicase UvrD [Candidatus Margulisiibacteriota bacterium]
MKFIADFHIHSHYSLATSKKLIPEYLDYWAKLKGIQVMGTGDCVHPGWLRELKEKLATDGNGLYQLKKEYQLSPANTPDCITMPGTVHFLPTTEISNIYKKNGKVRKVHNLCVFPDFASVEKFQVRLEKIGNIRSDGRPILGLDSRDLLEILLESSSNAFLIPAHIWTPWFSVLGSKSGFDTIEECYGDLTPHIFALETGLSSDPAMNWTCSFLDTFRLVSNSDAHSPEKLGREANIFDTELSYQAIYDALKYNRGFLGTIEFFPQEGKYHYDGHRNCNICWDPLETIKHADLCPVCLKPVTKGVLYRVAELADRNDITTAPCKKDFYSITSLPDIIAELENKKTTTKRVREKYFEVLKNIGPDFHTLLFAQESQIRESGGELLAESIMRMRRGQIYIEEGFDGEFGRITMFKKGELSGISSHSLVAGQDNALTAPPSFKGSIRFDIDQFQAQCRLKPTIT